MPSGGGYVSGGCTLSGVSLDPIADGFSLSSDAASWNSYGLGIPEWMYMVLYLDGTVDGVVKPLIGFAFGDDSHINVPATPAGMSLEITCPAEGWISLFVPDLDDLATKAYVDSAISAVEDYADAGIASLKDYVDLQDSGLASDISSVAGDLAAHAAETSPHEATAAATASRIVVRDSNGRAAFADPSAAADAATKGYVDTHAALTNPHSATSAATANRIILRDSNGRAKVATPSASDDIATKGYADGLVSAPSYSAGDVFFHSFSSRDSYFTNTSYAVQSNRWYALGSGTVTVNFSIKRGGSSGTCYGRIYKNGVAVGTERTDASANSFSNYSEDISVSAGDYLEIWCRMSSSSYQGSLGNAYLSADKNYGGTRDGNFGMYMVSASTNLALPIMGIGQLFTITGQADGLAAPTLTGLSIKILAYNGVSPGLNRIGSAGVIYAYSGTTGLKWLTIERFA